jgi:ABC-2 type transport system permease protein
MKLNRISGLLLKYFYISKNRWDRIFDIIYWPLVDLLVWGFMTAYISRISEFNLLSAILGGIIIWMFVWRTAQDISVFTLEDFWTRNLFNLFSSPITTNEFIVSVLTFALARSIVTFVFMGLMAALIYSFNLFGIGVFYVALFALALLILGWAIGTFITGFIFRFGERIQVLAWSVVWGIQPFSCVFYPLSALPPWAQKIAYFNPITHVFENLRAVIFGNAVNWYGVVYSFVGGIVLLSLTLMFLRHSIEKAKKTGLLVRGGD